MKRLILLITVVILALSSCTEQYRVRSLGGTQTITLKPGQKLMMATWKGSNLFYLTEPMDEGYKPKKKTFQENSAYGVIEATVIFIETR